MFRSIDELQEALRGKRYFASRGLTTTMFLALELERPARLKSPKFSPMCSTPS
jgi:hypothetical protein